MGRVASRRRRALPLRHLRQVGFRQASAPRVAQILRTSASANCSRVAGRRGRGVAVRTGATWLEEVQSDFVMQGSQTGVFNSRGVHWRGEGGDEELADKYRKWGKALRFSHPYVSSKLLMELAKTYEREASRRRRRGSDPSPPALRVASTALLLLAVRFALRSCRRPPACSAAPSRRGGRSLCPRATARRTGR